MFVTDMRRMVGYAGKSVLIYLNEHLFPIFISSYIYYIPPLISGVFWSVDTEQHPLLSYLSGNLKKNTLSSLSEVYIVYVFKSVV